MKGYESPKAYFLVLSNDLLTASGEDNPPEPCDCAAYQHPGEHCKASPQQAAYQTRGGI